MLTVRLQRVGRKNDPSFRMVIIDSKRGVKSADYIEMVGSYNPRQKGNTKIDGERVKHWISVGAKPTDTVHNLLISQKIIEGKKVNPLGKKTPIIKEKSEEEVKEKAEAVDSSADESAPADPEEKPTEEPEEEAKEETKEEPKEEAPAEEKPDEDKKEETKKETE